MFDFTRTTLFCLDKRLSKHKMTIFSKCLGGHGPFGPPWLRLWFQTLFFPDFATDSQNSGKRLPAPCFYTFKIHFVDLRDLCNL